jgi:thioredoxin 2
MEETMIAVCPKCRAKNRIALQKAREHQPVCGKCGGNVYPSMPGYTIEAGDVDFDEIVLRSGAVTLVDFYSNHCGPCRMMEPAINRLAEDLAGQARIVKVNTDRSPYTASKYGIMGVPTFVLFRGIEIGRAEGAQPIEVLKGMIERYRTPV